MISVWKYSGQCKPRRIWEWGHFLIRHLLKQLILCNAALRSIRHGGKHGGNGAITHRSVPEVRSTSKLEGRLESFYLNDRLGLIIHLKCLLGAVGRSSGTRWGTSRTSEREARERLLKSTPRRKGSFHTCRCYSECREKLVSGLGLGGTSHVFRRYLDLLVCCWNKQEGLTWTGSLRWLTPEIAAILILEIHFIWLNSSFHVFPWYIMKLDIVVGLMHFTFLSYEKHKALGHTWKTPPSLLDQLLNMKHCGNLSP